MLVIAIERAAPFAYQRPWCRIAFVVLVASDRDGEELAVAKHRKSNKRNRPGGRPGSLVLLGTAAGLSSVLVFGHATDFTADTLEARLANAAIGIGGRGDPTSANIPAKINHTVVPPGYTYVPVAYPAGFDIDNSVTAGVPVLHQRLTEQAAMPENTAIVIVGYSEGALVADREKRNLATSAPVGVDPDKVTFVLIASANVQNGGIFSRFPDLNIPFFVKSNGPAQPSEYDTTYYTNEYDPYADFPAYFNPLSLVNSLVAVQYVHPDAYYDTIDLTPAPAGPAITKTVTNSAGGKDTYVLVLADHLPLLAPVRQVFGAVGLTPLTEPVLGLIEPLLRLGVDMGYTDRLNLNPETPVQFSLFTPPERILQTIVGVPGAIEQGVNNLSTGVGSISATVAPATTPSALQAPKNSPSPTAKLAPQDTPQLPAAATPPKLPSAPVNPLRISPLSLDKTASLDKKNTTKTGEVASTAPSSSPSSAPAGQPSTPQSASPAGSAPAANGAPSGASNNAA
jgi:hypothetical protein